MSGVHAVPQCSTLPLLSAAALQLTLEHSACFIKTDIPWTHSGRRAVIYGLSEEKVSDSLPTGSFSLDIQERHTWTLDSLQIS